jgi:3-oxocholest-4-en-26-oate---CoA ligase
MALNFADLFEHAADAFGDRTAVACGDRQVTYTELEERTNRLAHHLAGLGVGPGDHVGLYARNSIEALETLIAACKLRASAVNINYRYVENELHYMFADSDLTALVYDRRLGPLVAASAQAAPRLRGLVEIDDGSDARESPQATPDAATPHAATPHPATPDAATPHAAALHAAAPDQATQYDTALAAASPERDFQARSNDDVYIIYTGGTTGYPKGVMWRHEDIWRTLGGGIDFITSEPLPDEWAQSRKGLDNGEFVKLCAAPLIHGNAQVAALAGLFTGETIVLLPAFDPHEIWRAITKHHVNVLVIIGDAMARPLIEAYAEGGYDASSLVAMSSSAALFSPAVKDACAEALPDVVITEAIGSTETGFAGIAFVTAGEPHRGGPTVMAGPDVIVLGDDSKPAGPGEVGRLARGGHVPLGYYKDPARTAAMFAEVDGKRYAVPGDMARVEDDGTLTLLGRGNTCVNTGGEKVFPEEVEGALKSHPDVFDALVIGVPDELLGQRVAALVQLRPGAAADLGVLQEHVRRQLAGYKVPRSIWLADAIRRTVSGKADYAWAREYAASHAPGLDRVSGAHSSTVPR